MRKLAVVVALLASCGSPGVIGRLGTTSAAIGSFGDPAPIQLDGCNPSIVNCSGGGSGDKLAAVLAGVGVVVVSAIAFFWRPGSDRTP